MHLIIDGYNLIQQTPELSLAQDLGQGRKTLLRALRLYRKNKSHRLTVVFDGGEEFKLRQASLQGVPVIFSGSRLSADQVIVELAQSQGEGATIITDDREMASLCRARGAEVIEARVFAARLMEAAQGSGLVVEDDEVGWNFSTKKKGPSHREPKAKRRRNSRLDKL
ncbi:NYN domain-containing protein [Desulfarculales bacterium]